MNEKDTRFYQLYGKDEKSGQSCHYFNYIVGKLLPKQEGNEEQEVLKNFALNLKKLSDGSQQ